MMRWPPGLLAVCGLGGLGIGGRGNDQRDDAPVVGQRNLLAAAGIFGYLSPGNAGNSGPEEVTAEDPGSGDNPGSDQQERG